MQRAGLGDRQRIDLDEAGVEFDESPPQAVDQRAGLVVQSAVELEFRDELRHFIRARIAAGAEPELVHAQLAARHLRLDILAALRTADQHQFSGRGIDQQGEMQLPRRGDRGFDEDALDLLAILPGLRRHQLAAEQPARRRLGRFGAVDMLDAAGDFASSGMNLGLHHDTASVELPRDLAGVARRDRDATGWRAQAIRRQQVFRLELMDFHRSLPSFPPGFSYLVYVMPE